MGGSFGACDNRNIGWRFAIKRLPPREQRHADELALGI